MQAERKTRAMDTASPSQHGAAAVAKGLICRETTECVAGAFADRLLALVLTGSLARDEATVISENGTTTMLGDAEFLLVFAEGAALPSPGFVEDLQRRIEGGLAQAGVSVSLELSPVPPDFLRKMAPHIFAYELRTCGQVVWGEPDILSLIPAFAAADIPLEDAFRLLCNRIIEVIDAAGEADWRASNLSSALHYRTVKLYQDMATSYLLFAGCYEPAYRLRADRLARIAADRQPASDLPFQLADFSARVSACTRFKLAGLPSGASSETLCPASADFLSAAVADAHALWRWELARLIGVQGHRSDADLMIKWMRTLPFRARVRGWAHVLRKCGWHRSFRWWPRWLRLAMKSSPRYCVYAAASQLFFRVGGLSEALNAQEGLHGDLRSVRSWLPVERGASNHPSGAWRQTMHDICWNYRTFLKDTRS